MGTDSSIHEEVEANFEDNLDAPDARAITESSSQPDVGIILSFPLIMPQGLLEEADDFSVDVIADFERCAAQLCGLFVFLGDFAPKLKHLCL